MTRRPANPAHAWYALRRTLPTWSFEDNLKELVELLPRYGLTPGTAYFFRFAATNAGSS